MTYLTDTADGPRPSLSFDLAALDRIDRILLGSCAAVWLAALGAGVAAAVALVDLSRGHTVSSSDSGTPWILYTIIAVSAVVILTAVPLLLRARRAALEEPDPDSRPQATATPPHTPARGAEADAPTEKFQLAAPAAAPEPGGPSTTAAQDGAAADEPQGGAAADEPQGAAGRADAQAIDQLWLRCAAGIACAAGVATLLTAVSTYLVAVGSNTVAWVFYGIAGAITLGMAAIPWYALRELRTLIDDR